MTRDDLTKSGYHQLTHPYHQSSVWELERAVKQLGREIPHYVYYDAETNSCEIWSIPVVTPIPEDEESIT
jgi:hypothetical protein